MTAPTRFRSLIRCAAQSAEIVVRRHAPDLLGVGLEEDLEEPRPKRLTTQSSKLRSGLIGRAWALR